MMESAPFNARLILAMSADRIYRIYCREAFYFVKVAGQGADFRKALGLLLGGLPGFLAMRLFEKRGAEKEAALYEALDRVEPASHLGTGAHNFKLRPTELMESSIEPPDHFGLHGGHVGRWIVHPIYGRKMTFQFEDLESMKSAVLQLPAMRGGGVKVNVEWSERKGKFIRKSLS